ncbi:MAG: hypothetical protein V2A74_14305 [bacterium]
MVDKEQYLNLGRPEKNCLLCGASLLEVEKHPSVLSVGEAEALMRRDYCQRCWEQLREEYFSFWITRREKPKQRVKISKKERNDALLRLFLSLYDDRANNDHLDRLYFLAHLLMKFGVLKWKSHIALNNGAPALLFEQPQTGLDFEIPQVEVSDERLSAIKGELEAYLSERHNLENPAL